MEANVEEMPATVSKEVLSKAYSLMTTAKNLAVLYEENKDVCSKYVHATSRGHEAMQLAMAFHLLPQDFVSPYYRDDSILLGIGITPYELMLQVLAKRDDPFSGGRTYYSHPSLRRDDMPKIPHQSSATGMQAIPSTGIAHGIQYREKQKLNTYNNQSEAPIVVCSIGDGAMTEGEVHEALHNAALNQLPIIYFVQDNDWDISASKEEVRFGTALDLLKGFKGIEGVEITGNDFVDSYTKISEVVAKVREERRPFMVYGHVPLLNHHTSGVRKEWYRTDLEEHAERDPLPILRNHLLENGFSESQLYKIEEASKELVEADYAKALEAEEPRPEDLYDHIFVDTPVTEELGTRVPEKAEEVVMVDAALHAIDNIMKEHPEALLYGQDVGGELGGVFREAATLTGKYGKDRVFNTPIQEAYIIGSTVGMSAVGLKPFVEVQFADYIWPGVNQLYAEVSRSLYLSNGKWPVSTVLRVPIGAYGSGGPFHSSSVESAILTIKGIKIVYPSNAADMKGLMRASYYDPNPIVMFEHKGLYWSKVPGSRAAKTKEPSDDYIVPLGKARVFTEASEEALDNGDSCVVIAYGMGVHWAHNAAAKLDGRVEVLDLRTLQPYDWEMIQERVELHGKALVLTEEVLENSFAESLAGKISKACFQKLDAPVYTFGSETTPAIPLNSTLESTMLPNEEKVFNVIKELLEY